METIVWWKAGGKLNKEVKRRPLYSGTQGGSLDK